MNNKRKEYEGSANSADPTCGVECDCGEELWVSDYKVVRCGNCGKGYKTEFIVWEYPRRRNNEI